MKKNYLTKEWYDALVKELKELKEIKLPAVLERLWEAKALGDLSENFEYKSALEDKDLINSRILEIETLINDVEIISEDKKKTKNQIVDYGSIVTIQTDDNDIYTVTIVGSWEITMDFDENFKAIKDSIKISLESPLGMAIKGKKVGEIGKMKLQNTKKDIKILDIR